VQASLLFFALIFFTSQVHGSRLFGVYTSATDTETIMWLSEVDMQTGTMTNITEIEVFGGGSASLDGLSTFDGKNNVYYFTNDYETPLLYAIDVVNKVNLPVTDLYATSIMKMGVNQNTGELIVAVYQDNVTNILAVSYPPGNLRTLVPAIPYEILGISYDGDDDLILLLVYSSPFDIITVDPQTGQLGTPIPVKGQTNNLYPEDIFYDTNTKKIISGGMNDQFEYGILMMDPKTGATTSDYPINADDGIITAWCLDNSDSWMWYAVATDDGPYVYAWDPVANNQTAMLNTFYVLENIEVSP